MTITIDQANPLVYRAMIKDKFGRDMILNARVAPVSDCRICKHFTGHDRTCAASDITKQIPMSAMRSIYSCEEMIINPNKRKKLI